MIHPVPAIAAPPPRATLHIGDNRDVLAGLPADSFHSIVTDPPYGLSDTDSTVGYRNCVSYLSVASAFDQTEGAVQTWTGLAGALVPLSASELPAFCEGLCFCLREVDGAYLLPVATPRGNGLLRFTNAGRTVSLTHDGVAWGTPRFAFAPAADIMPPGGTLSVPIVLSKRLRVSRDGFMGESWDGDPVAFSEGFWRECLRVLRPGGHLAAFGGTRTYHHLALAIERAGFEVKDTLAWMYPKGMPKSRDIGADLGQGGSSESGHFRAVRQAVARHIRKIREEVGLTTDAVSAWFPTQPDVRNWERTDAGYALPSASDYRTFVQRVNALAVTPPFREPTDYYDDALGEWLASDEAKNQAKRPRLGRRGDAPGLVGDWAGWGTALRPCYEPIVLARKPIAKSSVAANVIAFGAGPINIDGSRIGTRDPGDADETVNAKGRWPANFLFSHGAGCRAVAKVGVKGDERVGGQGTRPGGFYAPGSPLGDGRPCGPLYTGGEVEIWECEPGCPVAELDAQAGGKAPGAGPSRFYYVSKPSSREKNLGCDDLPEQITDVHARHYSRAAEEIQRFDGRPPTTGRNAHPTVKPVAIMRWLATLITPPGGTILDPFCGSGTTGVAAVNGGFFFEGIEANEDYAPTAIARLSRDADVRVVGGSSGERDVPCNTPTLPLW